MLPCAVRGNPDGAVRDRSGNVSGGTATNARTRWPDAPVVGHEVARPVGVAQPGSEQGVHERRLVPGNARELLGVEAELKDVSRLRRARGLPVGRLVGAVGLLLKKVGDPVATFVDEDAL